MFQSMTNRFKHAIDSLVAPTRTRRDTTDVPDSSSSAVSAVSADPPPLRVASISLGTLRDKYLYSAEDYIYDNDDDESSEPPWMSPDERAAVLWGALAVCAAAEQRAHVRVGSDSIPAALMRIEVNIGTHRMPYDAPFVGDLAERYPTLARSLRDLTMASCDDDDDLVIFAAAATQLREFTLMGCDLTSFRGFEGHCEFLRRVDLLDCADFSSLEGMEHHVYLEEVMFARAASHITSLEPLLTCPFLTSLHFDTCSQLASLDGLQDHHFLKVIRVQHAQFTSLEPLRTCSALTEVHLMGCEKLTSLAGLAGHQWLQEVDVAFSAITSIEPLRTCPALKKVHIGWCKQVSTVECLQHHQHLKELAIPACTAIPSVADLGTFPSLTTLDIRLCDHLPEDVGLPSKIKIIRWLEYR